MGDSGSWMDQEKHDQSDIYMSLGQKSLLHSDLCNELTVTL